MVKLSMMAAVFLLADCVFAQSTVLDVGAIDQKRPPTAEELQEPGGDAQVPTVGQYASVTGKVPEEAQRNVYVIVNPLSNPATRNTWWVQRYPRRDEEKFRGVSQLGEGAQGRGEYFAVLAIATDRRYTEGQRLQGLPVELKCSRVKIVKRAH